MNNEKYYIAYGSNLNFYQMSKRCPNAKFIGKGMIDNHKLTFRGSLESSVATIEPCSGSKVPVGIWLIDMNDEIALDRYEGYPRLYEKKEMIISNKNEVHKAIIYIMNDGFQLGIPNKNYYSVIKEGYQDCQLDEAILEQSIKDTVQEIEDMQLQEQYSLGYKDLR